jgi:hypothetical protein
MLSIKIIDNYSKTEDDGKLLEQAKLMTDDRVWIGLNGLGRMTNQSLNMNIQQFQSDAFQKSINGIKWFSDARDRLIKFYGDGKVAVASFIGTGRLFYHQIPILKQEIS